jgi:phospholipid-binding lipoprotein MlaA
VLKEQKNHMAMKGSNRFHFLPLRLFAIIAVISLAAGCATPPNPSDTEAYAEYREINDPLEPMNRGIFQLNRALDTWFLKPLAIMYREFLPPPFQRGIHNFLNNLRTPIVLANDLFQGEMDRAGTTIARFLINTTLGVGGLSDPATELGWEDHDEDFGQTLAVWGLPEGPYLMLPLLGPSSPRDGVGLAVDSFLIDPIGLLGTLGNDGLRPYALTRAVLTGIDKRARIYEEFEELEKTSLDLYASIRSLYRQHRNSEINQGKKPADALGTTFDNLPAMPNIPEIPDEDSPKPQ